MPTLSPPARPRAQLTLRTGAILTFLTMPGARAWAMFLNAVLGGCGVARVGNAASREREIEQAKQRFVAGSGANPVTDVFFVPLVR